MLSGYVVIEGHGETEAIQNLLNRLWTDLSLPYAYWKQPIRMPGLHLEAKVRKACNLVRNKPDANMLLLVRDADLEDDCPKYRGPEAATWIASERLPFPAAVAMLHKEYEVLFLTSLPSIVGRDWRDDRGNPRLGFPQALTYQGNPEEKRGVKEWLSEQLPRRRAYRPTLDQLGLTRLLDFDLIRQSGLPCFGTLERSLQFLADNAQKPGATYPRTATLS